MVHPVHHQRNVVFVGLKKIYHLAIEIPSVQRDRGDGRVIVVSCGMICQFFEIDIAIASMMKIRIVYDETGTWLRRRPTVRSKQLPQKMQQRNHGKPASLSKVAMEKFA